MKEFFKIMFASMLGTLVLILISTFIGIAVVAAIIAAASSSETVIQKNTLLLMKLDREITDRAPKSNFNFSPAGYEKTNGLDEILKNLRKAKNDGKIAGILLDLSEIPAGIATVDEIREGLNDFRSSGKFIWAYSEGYSQKTYYLATVADRIFLNPQGMFDFKGLTAESVYLKGLLEKLDIKMQIIRHGKFKAASEPLFLDRMSAENREQLNALIGDVWDRMLTGISETRKIGRDELNRIADSLKVETPDDALRYRFVDQLVYKDELIAALKKQMKVQEKSKIQAVTLDKYTEVPEPGKAEPGADKIAVIYASGTIGGGNGNDQSIGSERISKAIRKAREDDRVKAIVFRINSGGGSALASDVIWREVELAKKVKPVVASFGDVAASGGYYIACAATKILADPATITGSIGVFGVIPNMEGMFRNKLGITFDRAVTNINSDFPSGVKPLSPYQTRLIQREVDHIYAVFTGKVADGRDLTPAKVDSVGQGRVWSGSDALEIGLIDKFGGLTKAVEEAASLAKSKNYRVVSLPEQKEWFQELLDEITGSDEPSTKIREVLGDDFRLYQYYREIREMNGIQARMLQEISIY